MDKAKGRQNSREGAADHAVGADKGSFSFFLNRGCPYYPCHEGADPENFNCLFCYCPLYAMGPECGGNFRYNERGIKDCTACSFPHKRENYGRIIEKLREQNRSSTSAREKE